MEDGVVDAPAPRRRAPGRPRRSTVRSEVNRYRARGLGRARTKAMAWSRESTVSTGRMGPKISSCMTGSSGDTPSSTVGAMRSRSGSQPPPHDHLLPVQEGGQSHKVLLVYDLSITWILQGVRAIHAADFTDDFDKNFSFTDWDTST